MPFVPLLSDGKTGCFLYGVRFSCTIPSCLSGSRKCGIIEQLLCTTVSLSFSTLVLQVRYLASFVVGSLFCSFLFYPCFFLQSTPIEVRWSSLDSVSLHWSISIREKFQHVFFSVHCAELLGGYDKSPFKTYFMSEYMLPIGDIYL